MRKADPNRNVDKANFARYTLAFCYYKTNRFYEADVLAEHLARRYPQGGLSDKATEIAMQSVADAYNTYTEIDRMSDLDHLINLATYTAETWPLKDSGDQARMNLGQIYFGMGRYDEAIKTYNAIRPRSKQWIPVQNRLGLVHWSKSRLLEYRGDAPGAQAEAQKAIDALNVALKARRDAGTGQTDPGFIGNVSDLATVFTDTGKPNEALTLLDPVIKAQTSEDGSRILDADRSPAQDLHRHRPGRARDRLDQGPRASRRGCRASPALLQAGSTARERAGQSAGQERKLRPCRVCFRLTARS